MKHRQTSTLLKISDVSLDYDKIFIKFKHPARDYQVYATLNGFHMLTLERNEVEVFKIILS